MRSWECETRTAAGYLALNTLQHHQIRCESHRSVVCFLCARMLQVHSFARIFEACAAQNAHSCHVSHHPGCCQLLQVIVKGPLV